jgi:mono/diheme cytochrome c family protein
VDAEKFILRATDGKPRAELSLHDGRPSLALFDEKGNCRARLSVSADGFASLSLHDQDGQPRATLQVPAEGEPRLDLPKNQPVLSRPRPVPTAVRRKASKPSDEHLKAAQELFRQHCARCHGADGRGRRSRSLENIPDFTDAAWQARQTNPHLTASILAGRNDAMPSFDGRLSAAEARDLVALIRAFGPATAAPAGAPATDFEQQFRQLQQQYDELKKQLQEISPPARKP